MGLWVHVCVRQLSPTCDLRSNCMAGDSLGSSQSSAGRGALSYIRNLCWRAPEWTWGPFEPYGQNGPHGARLRASAVAHMWLKVKCYVYLCFFVCDFRFYYVRSLPGRASCSTACTGYGYVRLSDLSFALWPSQRISGNKMVNLRYISPPRLKGNLNCCLKFWSLVQCFPVKLCRKMWFLLWNMWMKATSENNYAKRYIREELSCHVMPYSMILTLESVNEIFMKMIKCDELNESYCMGSTLLSCYAGQCVSHFRFCQWKLKVWPLKWKLLRISLCGIMLGSAISLSQTCTCIKRIFRNLEI